MWTLAAQVLLTSREVDPDELDFLLRFPILPDLSSPVDFLSSNGWGGVKVTSCAETLSWFCNSCVRIHTT